MSSTRSSKKEKQPKPLFAVGIGSSAGGLEALSELLSHLPRTLDDTCLIIVQHLSPTYKSMLVQLLSKETDLIVKEAVSGQIIESNTIYITPPDNDIVLNKGKLQLRKPSNQPGPKPSVDVFFASLAQDYGDKAIGIILSGTGTDGAAGIRAIKVNGGTTIVQEPASAKYDGMPNSAIDTGHVDMILSPSVIGEELKAILGNSKILESGDGDDGIPQGVLKKIFDLLSKHYGTDFSNYKISTIFRRLQKRMHLHKIFQLEDYLNYLEKNAGEIDELFNNILIGVTSFFRDQDAFDEIKKYLAKTILQKKPELPIRIWVPGCASGEEAYSLAIVVAEILGDRLKETNVQIFATDIDEDALKIARKGQYAASSLANIEPDLLSKYFEKKGSRFEISKEIRSIVLFSRHDVTGNPPFLKLDLISCRNLLIYFGQDLQKHIIPLFHYSLNPDCYLFLGRSETVGHFTDLFSSVDGKNKIFQRKRGGNLSAIKFSLFRAQRVTESRQIAKTNREFTVPDMVKETLFNTFEHPYVVINDNMDVVELAGDVRNYLSLPSGQMNANLVKMAHPDLQIELRTIVSKSIRERIAIKSKIRKVQFFNQVSYVQLMVKPLLYSDPNDELFIVIFERLDAEGLPIIFDGNPVADGNGGRMLELEQELAATREHLQTFIEELETSNEELQSLNEELQATNEELQSSNEELETTNEELQSSNEEIQVAYAELKQSHETIARKERELQQSQSNVKALLNNTLQSFVLIDRNYRIVDFNNTAWRTGLEIFSREMRSGVSIIDFILPNQLADFYHDFNQAILGEVVYSEKCIRSMDGFPRWYLYNYTPVYNEHNEVDVISFSILDITALRQAQADLANQDKLINMVFDLNEEGICITDQHGNFVQVNRKYCEIYGFSEEEIIGNSFTRVVPEENREYAQKLHDEFIVTGIEIPSEWEVVRVDGQKIKIFVRADLLIRDDGQRFKVTTIRLLK
jgi:two-component system CheB/CheR fusion protein